MGFKILNMRYLSLVVLFFVFASCKKEYNWNCQCNVDGAINDWSINGKIEEDASTDCENREAVLQANVNVTNASCTLIKVE